VEGIVLSINISSEKGQKKRPVERARITMEGIEGDAHAGKWHRQLSLLAEESIEKMRKKGLQIGYGDFAENITTKGINLAELKVGQRLKIGNEVVIEVTQVGKKCHDDCEIKKITGECVMPKEGIFARVIVDGTIRVGDSITIME
jgi:MOSC domain-containing protein YiiM